MKRTRSTSNTNQLSEKAVFHVLNANHLMRASAKNHAHQMLSKMMKPQSVSRYVVPLLKSASAWRRGHYPNPNKPSQCISQVDDEV